MFEGVTLELGITFKFRFRCLKVCNNIQFIQVADHNLFTAYFGTPKMIFKSELPLLVY